MRGEWVHLEKTDEVTVQKEESEGFNSGRVFSRRVVKNLVMKKYPLEDRSLLWRESTVWL